MCGMWLLQLCMSCETPSEAIHRLYEETGTCEPKKEGELIYE